MGSLRGPERAGAGSRAGSALQFNTAGSCAGRLTLASLRSGPTSLSAFVRTPSSLQGGMRGSAGARGMEAGGAADAGRGLSGLWHPRRPRSGWRFGSAPLGESACASVFLRRMMPNPPKLGRTT